MIGQVQDVDLKLLRVFETIARTGGFTAAQAELNTSQGFISSQMKALEDRLGTRLCQRGHAGFKLTESGEAILQAATELFEALDEFRSKAESAVDPLRGEVRVGVIDQIATSDDCTIAPAINSFADRAPNASITLSIVPPMDLEMALLDGTIEMAYGIFHHHLPGLSYEMIGSETHELYCSTDHPLVSIPSSRVDNEFLKEFAYVGWDYLETGDTIGSPLESEARAASPYMEAVLHYILSGRYIGFLPSHVARSWVADGKLRSICEANLTREVPVELVTRKAVELSPLAQEFVAALFDARNGDSSD